MISAFKTLANLRFIF